MQLAGFDGDEIEQWSYPKFKLRLRLVEEIKINDFLTQSLAVWEPKKVVAMRETAEARTMNTEQEWTPPSERKFLWKENE